MELLCYPFQAPKIVIRNRSAASASLSLITSQVCSTFTVLACSASTSGKR